MTNRLLKLEPSNVKLLAQKQKLLQQEVGETSNKLNALKEADKRVKLQLENGRLSQDKYDVLQREIIETENKLKSLEEEYKKVPSALSSSMKEVGNKIMAVGDKTAEVGKNISMHLTAPIVAMGALSLAAFKEVDKNKLVSMKETDEEYYSLIDEIETLRFKKDYLNKELAKESFYKERFRMMDNFIESSTIKLDEYDDELVKKILYKVLIGDEKIEVVFKSNETVILEAK